MPQDKMEDALSYASECDLCIVLGSSLVVYPAASVPAQAVQNGAKLIIINRDETPLDAEADLVFHESVSEALEQMVRDLSS
jgi:NAD-dependent deacetylase